MSTAPILLLTAAEACAALSVSRKTLYLLTAPRGTLRSIRIGSAVRWSVAELERWVAEQQAAAEGTR